MNIFENIPTLENENFLLRKVEEDDLEDLRVVYSDKNALPFFNSDGCDGDIFFYDTLQKMLDALSFWRYSYDHRWFARLSIVDKSASVVIGTIELCYRVSEDIFNKAGILRLDVRSDYEKEDSLYEILTLIVPRAYELIGCEEIITKAPAYAVDRIRAIQNFGFEKSDHFLIGGRDGYAYNGYWTLRKR